MIGGSAISEERRQKFEANPDTLFLKEKEILENWKATKS